MDSVIPLVSEGLKITGIGMSVVFVLLTVLVGTVQGMSAFCRQFARAEDATPDATRVDDELLSIIAAAIGHYRRGG